MSIRRAPLLLLAAATVSLAACSDEDEKAGGDPANEDDTDGRDGIDGESGEDGTDGSDGETAAVTWHRDVQPVLADHCFACHNPEGIGFDLTDYETTALLAEAIVAAVDSGAMPPWPPAEDCAPLAHERRVSPDEQVILEAWLADDTPEGEPGSAPDNTSDTDVVLPDEDVVMELPVPYTPNGTDDDYRCFVVDPEFAENVQITGFQVHPGNPAIVHHMLLYTDPENQAQALDEADDGPGYTCFGDPGFYDTSVVGAWAPGSPGVRLPEGTGLPVDAGTKLVIQMHYSPAGDPGGSDQSIVSIDLAEESVTPVLFFPFLDPRLEIPAGAADHVEGTTQDIDFGVDLILYGGGPHMHRLGRSINIERETPDGEVDCLIDIPDWDFNTQEIYMLEEPMRVNDGDKIRLECTYDNSESNPYATGTTVRWGDATDDEMCLVYALVGLAP